MKRFTVFLAFALVLAGASAGLAVYESAGMHTYKASLSGATEPPGTTMATGEASFELVPAGTGGTPAASGDVIRYQLRVKKIKNVRASHLHKGIPGTAEGPVIMPLFLGPEKSGEFSGMLASGTITSKDLTGPFSGRSIADLVALIKSGDVYVNVHTAAHPAGEIKGTVKE